MRERSLDSARLEPADEEMCERRMVLPSDMKVVMFA